MSVPAWKYDMDTGDVLTADGETVVARDTLDDETGLLIAAAKDTAAWAQKARKVLRDVAGCIHTDQPGPCGDCYGCRAAALLPPT